MPQDNMSKQEFMAAFDAGEANVRPKTKSSDWNALFEQAKVTFKDLPFTLSDFWVEVVKGAVTEQRTRTKLKELHAKGLVHRVMYRNAWNYMFLDE